VVFSGDCKPLSTDVYREHYGAITLMNLEVLGIVIVAGLAVWLARRHPKLSPEFQRIVWLWISGLNGIVCAYLGGMIYFILLKLFAPLPWRSWMSWDALGLTVLGLFLFATFNLVASVFFLRIFINTWKTPKTMVCAKKLNE
jgi:hypothetical protein